jgi:Integrase core domain
MVTAVVRNRLAVPVNRKRVLRLLRERKLIQRRRPLNRRKRPGFFQVERPRQLWQLDMTSIWVAEHGCCYLNAIIDCCTREIVAWSLELRCRADEAIAVVERAAALHGIEPGQLLFGSDNGSAFTARRFRARLAELGIRHRRGGYRDPESQGLHREPVGETERTGGVAERIRDARRRQTRHRRLRRPLPPAPTQQAELPDTPPGRPDLGGPPGTTKTRGLNCQHRRGAGQRCSRRCLLDRSSRPRSSPRQLTAEQEAPILPPPARASCRLRPSTASQVPYSSGR